MSPRRLWIVLLLAVTACWGASFAIIHEAVEDVDPYLFVTLRFAVAAALILALGRRRMLAAITRSTLRDGAWLGLLLAAGYLLQTAGLARTSPSNAAFLTGISVVLVPVLLAFGGWRLPRTGWLAIVLASVGLGILTLDPQTLSLNLGDVLSIGCACAYAGQIVLTGRCSSRHDLWALTFVEFVVTTLVSAAVWAISGAPTAGLDLPGVWGALGFASILCTVIAYLVMNAAQRVVSSWEAGLVFTTEPIFAAVVALALGVEPWRLRTTIGGLLILAAMVTAEAAQRAAGAEEGDEEGGAPSPEGDAEHKRKDAPHLSAR
ncbi:DMT family transporter [Sorangium sp. So ce321]|uniref:DMT family transporter n=1 Tax=Sorangium sp. So ce321 TaxID=3133300 RepID=UPI003F5DC789